MLHPDQTPPSGDSSKKGDKSGIGNMVGAMIKKGTEMIQKFTGGSEGSTEKSGKSRESKKKRF